MSGACVHGNRPIGFYVYALLDGEIPFYIGKGNGRRVYRHFSKHSLVKKTMVYAKMRKLTMAGREPTARVLLDSLTESEAFAWESFFVLALGRRDIGTGCLCNHTNGGEGMSGRICSPELRSKIAERLRGRQRPREVVEKIAAKIRGQKQSPESVAKRVAACRNHKRSTIASEQSAAKRRGSKRTPEQRLRMRDAIRHQGPHGKAVYKGVTKQKNHFCAFIQGRYLGSFVTPEDAARAYNEAVDSVYDGRGYKNNIPARKSA